MTPENYIFSSNVNNVQSLTSNVAKQSCRNKKLDLKFITWNQKCLI